ncbi:MAG: hypothetical protein J0I99_00565 [Devosia sp.]|uniref:hypothetical protein n=1 Tax=Devosia sp. TaxID=1871048 RepID=UPI001AC1908B|nr:hypothetical protein [Devosia sp.]MBN9314209.1 hypothetical protein [Devosia sp.]
MDPEYIAKIEQAVLEAEQFVADVATAIRKGYNPRPAVFAAADAVRERRRTNPATTGTQET